MFFKERIFNKINKNELYKEKMNGFNDESLKDYSLLSTASIYKEEIKNVETHKEYLSAYMRSAELLLKEHNQNNKVNEKLVKFVISENSLAIPIIYICRHCVELSIKLCIYKIENKQFTHHKLKDLWNHFVELISFNEEEKELILEMGYFVECIEEIDEKSTRLRYPLDSKNNNNQSIPLFVNCNIIFQSTKNFVNQLFCLDYDKF